MPFEQKQVINSNPEGFRRRCNHNIVVSDFDRFDLGFNTILSLVVFFHIQSAILEIVSCNRFNLADISFGHLGFAIF